MLSLPNIMFVILVLMLLTAVASLPTWRYSRSWGYFPSAGMGVVVLVLFVLLLTGRI